MIMSTKLQSPFLGIPLHCSSFGGLSNANALYSGRGRGNLPKRASRRCVCIKKRNDWVAQAIRFSHFCGKNIELLRNAIGSRNGSVVECVKDPLERSKLLVRSISSLWKEGLLLVRCSVFFAVVSGVCLLVWYGQSKAKGYVEAKLLPSVCSVLSDYIMREITVGRVRSVSPLSITLETCSIGPHAEEFSCGEVPVMKIRLRPFACLRRGKIVIDAVLSNPTVVVAQKKDYTWLGIPSFEEGLRKHLSTEEGIDYRTRTRRAAREEQAARWVRERDNDAKEAAEKGYIVIDRDSIHSDEDGVKEHGTQFTEFRKYESFLCMDDKTHWIDHHCMDTGLDYDMKHADLEKSFGVKFPRSSLNLWSGDLKGPKNQKFRRKANGSDTSEAVINAKRRILERSASVAVVYFQGLSDWKSDDPCQTLHACDTVNLNSFMVQSEGDSAAGMIIDSGSAKEQDEESGIQALAVSKNVHGHVDSFNVFCDPFLTTLSRLNEVGKFSENFPPIRNFPRDADTNKLNDNESEIHPVGGHMDAKPGSTQTSNLSSFLKNFAGKLSQIVSNPVQKLKYGPSPKVDDIVAELLDGVDLVQAERIDKMLPVSVDSVYFKAGTLLLLAYGDREPREMENANGQVRFQNHYGRVHVQLSGNCKMWRCDTASEDGGWLSADVFVDTIEQNWHANLNIVNLFVPLFERILEIPIAWSKGRSTGSYLHVKRGDIS